MFIVSSFDRACVDLGYDVNTVNESDELIEFVRPHAKALFLQSISAELSIGTFELSNMIPKELADKINTLSFDEWEFEVYEVLYNKVNNQNN